MTRCRPLLPAPRTWTSNDSEALGALGAGQASACERMPEGLSEAELKAYAEECGKDKAYDLVAEETGIDARAYLTDGEPDWRKVASAVVLYETGVSVNVGNIVNEDGSFNWRGAAAEAGGIAAAAVCAA